MYLDLDSGLGLELDGLLAKKAALDILTGVALTIVPLLLGPADPEEEAGIILVQVGKTGGEVGVDDEASPVHLNDAPLEEVEVLEGVVLVPGRELAHALSDASDLSLQRNNDKKPINKETRKGLYLHVVNPRAFLLGRLALAVLTTDNGRGDLVGLLVLDVGGLVNHSRGMAHGEDGTGEGVEGGEGHLAFGVKDEGLVPLLLLGGVGGGLLNAVGGIDLGSVPVTGGGLNGEKLALLGVGLPRDRKYW